MCIYRYLNLNTNLLSGGIPDSLQTLTNVVTLNLGSNLFTGTVPASLQSLHSCTQLLLSKNQLTGAIPAQLAGLPVVQQLHLCAYVLVQLCTYRAVRGDLVCACRRKPTERADPRRSWRRDHYQVSAARAAVLLVSYLFM